MQNRKTLKEYFRTGNLPTEENFADLIDSMVNIRNDGINRSYEHGLYITTTAETDRLFSFFGVDNSQTPVWVIDMNNNDNLLLVKNNQHKTGYGHKTHFVIAPDGKLGINTEQPVHELDVNGVVSCCGRIGNYNCRNGEGLKIPADGEWHELIGNLKGCNAFEIVAGVGKKKTGKYALMHVIAINIYGKRKKIRYTQSHYMSRNNRIRLKWVGNQKEYKLMLRTMSDYGLIDKKNICVNCFITRLWFDERMDKCLTDLT